jgi:RimJ/RimL family protein N-acetyltransferase
LVELIVPKTDNDNLFLCRWCAQRIGSGDFKNARALGFSNGTGIIAVVVLHDFAPPNVFLSWASESPRWLTRRTIVTIFDWAFNQLKCERITGLVERKNKRARKIDEGLGMKLEGVWRKASPSGQDLFVYGMLRSEAEQLIRRIHGQAKRTSST